ncbi:MAG: NAD(P)H-hydrate dehydratase [Candidatus Odinarchaeia archaeon]
MKSISTYKMRILEINSVYLGLPLHILMENAGRAVYEEIRRRIDLKNKRVTVLCGTGNNGGDGLVAARHLSAHTKVNVILLGKPEKIVKKEAKMSWGIITNLYQNVKVHLIDSKDKLNEVLDLISQSDIIVDAVLGTGIKGELREPIKSTIDAFNKSKALKVAVDVPTGLNPDTGDVKSLAVKADFTVTFHLPKPGLISNPQPVGELLIAPIGIPKEAAFTIGPGEVKVVVKNRNMDSKKGDFGKLLIIGGSENYHGAPLFSAMAAMKTGVDLVILSAPELISHTLRTYSPNLIVRPYPGSYLTVESLKFIDELISWADAVVIGPGLGVKEETKTAVKELFNKIKSLNKPAVIDADALKVLAMNKTILKNSKTVVTPHRGEFKLLTGLEIKSSKELISKLSEIKKEVSEFGITFAIKGSVDLITDGVEYKLNFTGNPGMTVGGTGDVLTGIIGCLLSQSVEPFDAAAAAVFLNGLAGDLLLDEFGFYFTAADLANNIPKAIDVCLKFPDHANIAFPTEKLAKLKI